MAKFYHPSTKSNLHCLQATVTRTTPQPFFQLLCSRVFLLVFLRHKTQETRPVLPTHQSAGKRLGGGGWEPRGRVLSKKSKYEPFPSHIVIPMVRQNITAPRRLLWILQWVAAISSIKFPKPPIKLRGISIFINLQTLLAHKH